MLLCEYLFYACTYVTAGPSVRVLQIEEHLKSLRCASSIEELHESWHIFAPEVVSLMRLVYERQMVSWGHGEGKEWEEERMSSKRGERRDEREKGERRVWEDGYGWEEKVE